MITVGKELLIGRTLNTNGHWIGRRLAMMGTMISRMTVVDDNVGEIKSTLGEALERSPDFVVIVGGLGPTPDDITLRGVARAIGRKLRLNGTALRMIREHYARMGLRLEITPHRRKMAILPEGSTPLLNREGTAPGVRVEHRGSVIYCLPGVPREMKGIFLRSVEGEIRAKVGRLFRKVVRLDIEGVYESSLAPLIAEEVSKYPSAYIKSHPKGVKGNVSRIELDIVFVSENRSDAQKLASAVAEEMTRKIEVAGGVVRRRAKEGGV